MPHQPDPTLAGRRVLIPRRKHRPSEPAGPGTIERAVAGGPFDPPLYKIRLRDSGDICVWLPRHAFRIMP